MTKYGFSKIEIEQLRAELAAARGEAEGWRRQFEGRGYVMKELERAIQRAEAAEAENAKLKAVVDVARTYENWGDSRLDAALAELDKEE